MKLNRTILDLAGAVALAGAVGASDQPNVIFILADDLGWADTTLYGHTSLYETPNLERLAKRGMVFTRAYSASPLCSPTRSSILTGQTPARTGFTAPNGHLPNAILHATVQERGEAGNKALQTVSITRLDTHYPTLLKAARIPLPEDHPIDGVDITPALRGGSLVPRAIFTYFPHHPPVPDWLPPSMGVHSGDWKLIRLFHQGDQGAHDYRLFNLKDDLGEANDLVKTHPEKVRQLDRLIEDYIAQAKAVVPLPNPAFNPAQYHPERIGQQPGGLRVEGGNNRNAAPNQGHPKASAPKAA